MNNDMSKRQMMTGLMSVTFTASRKGVAHPHGLVPAGREQQQSRSEQLYCLGDISRYWHARGAMCRVTGSRCGYVHGEYRVMGILGDSDDRVCSMQLVPGSKPACRGFPASNGIR